MRISTERVVGANDPDHERERASSSNAATPPRWQ
jgi:hypothetical protein